MTLKMSQIFSEKITTKQDLFLIFLNLAPFLNISGVEFTIYQYVLSKIFLTNSISLVINLRLLWSGDLANRFFGVNCSRRNLYKAMSRLQDKNVIYRGKNQSEYVLNMPGLSQVLLSFYGWIPATLELIVEQSRGLKIDFGEIIRTEENIMKLEEAIERGKNKNKNALKRKHKRLDARLPNKYTPAIVFQFLQIYSKESDILLFDRHTAILRGQIRNWITDCKSKDVDIKARLKQLCICWRALVSLQDETGTKLAIGGAVSFKTYYLYQKYIDPWLDEHGKEFEEESNKPLRKIHKL